MLTHKGKLRRPRRYHPGGYATPQRASLDMPRRVDQPPVRGGRCGPHDFHDHYPLPPWEKGLGGPTRDDRGIAPGLLPGDSLSHRGLPKTRPSSSTDMTTDKNETRKEETCTARDRPSGTRHAHKPP